MQVLSTSMSDTAVLPLLLRQWSKSTETRRKWPNVTVSDVGTFVRNFGRQPSFAVPSIAPVYGINYTEDNPYQRELFLSGLLLLQNRNSRYIGAFLTTHLFDGDPQDCLMVTLKTFDGDPQLSGAADIFGPEHSVLNSEGKETVVFDQTPLRYRMSEKVSSQVSPVFT